jgi:hypothetical protein
MSGTASQFGKASKYDLSASFSTDDAHLPRRQPGCWHGRLGRMGMYRTGEANLLQFFVKTLKISHCATKAMTTTRAGIPK